MKPEPATAVAPEPRLEFLPLPCLTESRANPRRHFDKADLAELAASIREKGILTPLTVRPAGDKFEIAAGARRFRASQIVGLDYVPAIVREMSDVEFLEFLVIENNQRSDVHPLEEGQGFRSLMKAGYTVERIAERVGRTPFYVYDRLRLLDLAKDVQEIFLDGKIPFSHARLLSRLSPEDQARAIAMPKDDYGHGAGGVFTVEHQRAIDEDADEDAAPPVKPRSVRELEDWINENVRFRPDAKDTKVLFPETAAKVEEAAKWVQITREYQIRPAAGDGPKILTMRSWKRADGKKDPGDYSNERPKVCSTSVLGVVVLGPGRGEEAFQVCVDRDCETHWGKEQRERAKQAKTGSRAKAAHERQQQKWEEERKARDAADAAWRKATPEILEAVAEALGKASVAQLEELGSERPTKAIAAVAPKGRTADAVLRRLVFYAVAREATSLSAAQNFPKIAKRLGVDLAKILKAAQAKSNQK